MLPDTLCQITSTFQLNFFVSLWYAHWPSECWLLRVCQFSNRIAEMPISFNSAAVDFTKNSLKIFKVNSGNLNNAHINLKLYSSMKILRCKVQTISTEKYENDWKGVSSRAYCDTCAIFFFAQLQWECKGFRQLIHRITFARWLLCSLTPSRLDFFHLFLFFI